MSGEVWVQCQNCGKLCRVESKNVSVLDDDLYTDPIWCSCCKNYTKHLDCGNDEVDIYFYYNVNLDPRIY